MQNQINKASALVEAAQRAGADAADVVLMNARSVNISVRLGKVEETESSESDDFTLRVFVKKQMASVSGSSQSDMQMLAERAVAMAKVSPENPWEGLADKALLIKEPKELDLFDTYEPDSALLTNDALRMEEAALAVKGVTNSGGVASAYGTGSFVLVTSDGFCNAYKSSRFTRSASMIAGEGTAMERDYDYSSALYFSDLDEAEKVGHSAGERAVKRLSARQAKTGKVNVVFDPRVARGLAAHLATMVNGAAVARKTSLLQEKMGKRIMAAGLRVSDNPLLLRGSSSRPFDGEGIEGHVLDIVEDGYLKNWLLSCSAARELGLQTNGHGVRSSSSVSPASTNFAIEPGTQSPEELIQSIGTGFYVNELVGHGIDFVTGQYSRGASGFWIENGQLQYPVSGVTLGSDLLHMFSHLTPANDLDRRFGMAAPTLAIEGMTLAGS